MGVPVLPAAAYVVHSVDTLESSAGEGQADDARDDAQGSNDSRWSGAFLEQSGVISLAFAG